MKRMLGFILLCGWVAWTGEARAAKPKPKPSFDAYQASVNARDCRIKVYLNGEYVEFLSGDGSHGLATSVPLSALDLVKKNTIKILVEAPGEAPSITVNVQGINLDEDKVVDTREPGDVLKLELGAKQIRSAKTRSFTATFTANLRGYYQPFTSEKPIIEYATRLYELFQRRDLEGLAAEMIPVVRKDLKPGATEAEAKAEAIRGLGRLLDGAVFKTIDPKQISVLCQASLICRPFVGEAPMLQMRSKGNAPDDFDPVRIGIAQIGGKLQIVRFLESD